MAGGGGEAFGGQGSCGNGAAMRVAPLGAYFCDDLDTVVAQATRSAEVTHQHPEGIAGGVAVAVASAVACSARLKGTRPAPREFLDAVLDHIPDGQVRGLTARSRGLLGKSVAEAAYELGNGSRVTAQDTVPFTLWVAASFLDDYRGAVTSCVEAGGDVDTTAAIVGGIVGRPPAEWLAAREPLPDWVAR